MATSASFAWTLMFTRKYSAISKGDIRPTLSFRNSGCLRIRTVPGQPHEMVCEFLKGDLLKFAKSSVPHDQPDPMLSMGSAGMFTLFVPRLTIKTIMGRATPLARRKTTRSLLFGLVSSRFRLRLNKSGLPTTNYTPQSSMKLRIAMNCIAL